jgi:rRNA maturation protein Nop10
MLKTRRIKCDETRPSCLQCLKSRRKCGGYLDNPVPWIFEPSDLYQIYKTAEERQLAHFYRHAGVSTLQLLSHSAGPFLGHTVQQLAHSFKPVKLAMICLSAQVRAVLEIFCTRPSSSRVADYRTVSISCYSRAVSSLAGARDLPTEMVMVCCSLLLTTELFPKKGNAPHIHAKAGLDLALSQPESAWKEHSVKAQMMHGFLWYCHNLSAFFDVMEPPPPDKTPLLLYAFGPSRIPQKLDSTSDAVECVETLLRSVMHLHHAPTTTDALARQKQLKDALAAISSVLDSTLATPSKDVYLHQDIRVLKIHLRSISLLWKHMARRARWCGISTRTSLSRS